MPISTDNLIVLYREDSDDSYEFAAYYADRHGLDYSQLVPVPCSGDEILDSYADFQTQVENAVKAEIDSEYGSEIRVILVGYNVPGGFIDGNDYGEDIISTTSRLSRVNHTFSKGLPNPLYSRQGFKRYDDADAETALIVSRIDAPTLDEAKAIVDNIGVVKRQGVANGKLFFDPYAPTLDAEEDAYKSELLDFDTQLGPVLNIQTYRTTFWDEETDVVIPRLDRDSFMWAWKADRAGYTFFKDKTTARVFLYNGDTDGAESVRDPLDKRWPMLALNAGYAACAGAMSDPLPEGLLRPKPFFNALFRGATVGEAFLYAVPNLDWTVTLFGDPLLLVKFPSAAIVNDGFTSTAGFEAMGRDLQSAIAFTMEREKAYIDIFNTIMDTQDVQVLTEIMAPFAGLANDSISRTKNDFVRLVSAYSRFPRTTETLEQYLATRQIKVSRLLEVISSALQLPTRLVYPQGSWEFETSIVHPDTDFSLYDFQLQLSHNVTFTNLINTGKTFTSVDNLILNADSEQNKTGWFYEKESNTFSEIERAVTSSYAGRRVRYVASPVEFFAERQVYYLRYRQVNEFSEHTAWQVHKQVVGT